MKLVFCVLGVLAGAVVLIGCGGGKGAGADESAPSTAKPALSEASPPPECPKRSEQLQVTLDGHAGPENVGILMAEKRGFFREAGLRVWVASPAEPKYTVPYVAAGGFGVARQPQVVVAREKGAPLVGFGALVPQPTEAMIWLGGSGIDSLADLEGKTIAYPGVSFQRSLLESVLARAGLTLEDVKLKQVGYELVSTLLSGKADAIFGGSWNLEGVALKARGAQPVITKVQDLGIPSYAESVVIAPYECVYKHPGLMRDFLDAVARGTEVAVADPRGAARVIEEDVESDPTIGRRGLEAQLKATLPLLSRSGFLNPGRQEFLDWMKEEGLIKQQWAFAVLFTNFYL